VIVDCISRLSGPVMLTLRYTTPDTHCRQAVRVRRWNKAGIDLSNAHNNATNAWSRRLLSVKITSRLMLLCLIYQNFTIFASYISQGSVAT